MNRFMLSDMKVVPKSFTGYCQHAEDLVVEEVAGGDPFSVVIGAVTTVLSSKLTEITGQDPTLNQEFYGCKPDSYLSSAGELV